MDDQAGNQIEEILAAYKSIGRALSRGGDEWLKLDLSMAQMKALFVVADCQMASIGFVADALGVGLSTGSHLVDKLVRSGLVERVEDPLDRRRAQVRLSPHGRALAERLREGRHDEFRDRLARMDPDDRDALLRGLKALSEIMRRAGDAGEADPGKERSALA